MNQKPEKIVTNYTAYFNPARNLSPLSVVLNIQFIIVRAGPCCNPSPTVTSLRKSRSKLITGCLHKPGNSLWTTAHLRQRLIQHDSRDSRWRVPIMSSNLRIHKHIMRQVCVSVFLQCHHGIWFGTLKLGDDADEMFLVGQQSSA